MKTNKNVILISSLLIQFFELCYYRIGLGEWSEIFNDVIPFSLFFLVCLFILKEYNVYKANH